MYRTFITVLAASMLTACQQLHFPLAVHEMEGDTIYTSDMELKNGDTTLARLRVTIGEHMEDGLLKGMATSMKVLSVNPQYRRLRIAYSVSRPHITHGTFRAEGKIIAVATPFTPGEGLITHSFGLICEKSGLYSRPTLHADGANTPFRVKESLLTGSGRPTDSMLELRLCPASGRS